MKYKYPLQTVSLSLWQRLKIGAFILNPANRLTMGPKVAELESKLKDYSGADYTVSTTSGSTANAALFEIFKQVHKVEKFVVFVPANTWISSLSPIVSLGGELIFVDINKTDFSMDLVKLQAAILKVSKLSKYKGYAKVIWPTFLIGLVPDILCLKKIAVEMDCYLFADACENAMSVYVDEDGATKSVLSCFDMTTTSMYTAHQLPQAVELGCIFINNGREDYYERALTVRNHGLSRALPKHSIWRKSQEYKYRASIDKQFLFLDMGTNYRASELHALVSLVDWDNTYKFETKRKELGDYFYNELKKNDFYWFPENILDINTIAFCLPILAKKNYDLPLVKEALVEAGWETRPIIGGNLLLQPSFQKYGRAKDFPVAQNIATCGLYVGLHPQMTKTDIDNLLKVLNEVSK